MANWFYFGENGDKLGPIDSTTLKTLAKHGIITLDSDIETDTGKRAKAKNIKGLEFQSVEPKTHFPDSKKIEGSVFCKDQETQKQVACNTFTKTMHGISDSVLEITKNSVVIKRPRSAHNILHGKAELMEFPYSEIIRIEIKEAGNIFRGCIKFVTNQSIAGGAKFAFEDSHIFMFQKQSNDQAIEIYDCLCNCIGQKEPYLSR